jgi:ATP-dependent Clp protease ATP-binding subunit ClpB
MNLLRQNFKPEFLNRIDEIVIFKPLSLDEIEKIVDLLLDELKKRLEEHEIDLELTESARRHIAETGYDPVYGARPLKRFIQKSLETAIAKKIIAGEISDGMKIKIDFVNGELSIEATETKA